MIFLGLNEEISQLEKSTDHEYVATILFTHSSKEF